MQQWREGLSQQGKGAGRAFFQEGDGKDPVLQEIRWKVFGVAADGNILDDGHPVAQALVQLPVPVIA